MLLSVFFLLLLLSSVTISLFCHSVPSHYLYLAPVSSSCLSDPSVSLSDSPLVKPSLLFCHSVPHPSLSLFFFLPLIVLFLSIFIEFSLVYSSRHFFPFHSFHISISFTVTPLLSIPSLPSLPPSCPYCPLISLLAVWPSTKLTANTQGMTAKTSQSSCQEAARRCHLENTHTHTQTHGHAHTHTHQ